MTNKEKIELMRTREKKIELGGGAKALEKVKATGRLSARERLARLFDEGSLVELDKFVEHRCVNFGMDQTEVPGEGVVTGYGTGERPHRLCLCAGFQHHGRLAWRDARRQDRQVPGTRASWQEPRSWDSTIRAARGSRRPSIRSPATGGSSTSNTMASGIIPQISAIMGPSAGGAVYSPALMDFIYMVDKEYAQMFITGPQVVKAVMGEEVTAMELGGAMTHNTKSGVAHFVAASDEDCIDQIKKLLSYLPSNNTGKPPVAACADPVDRMEEKLNTIVPEASNRPYDIKKVIKLVVDNGEIYESQALFAMNMVTCFARMNGQPVGIIANQPAVMAGCLDINSSDKASRFIRFCDCFNLPILTFVDVPGYLPGTGQEYGGIIRHGAKMLYVYPEATVPKITIVVRKAYGGSYLGMCSGQTGADVVMAWPSAEIAVMGAEGAAKIIFRKEDPENLKKKTQEYIDNFATPYQAARHGLIEQVIEPKETRPMIIKTLKMLENKKEDRPWKKHGNIPL